MCVAYFRVHKVMEVATKVKSIIFQGQDQQFGASVYLWNIAEIIILTREVRKVLLVMIIWYPINRNRMQLCSNLVKRIVGSLQRIEKVQRSNSLQFVSCPSNFLYTDESQKNKNLVLKTGSKTVWNSSVLVAWLVPRREEPVR